MGEQGAKIMDGREKRKRKKAAPTLPNLAERDEKEKRIFITTGAR